MLLLCFASAVVFALSFWQGEKTHLKFFAFATLEICLVWFAVYGWQVLKSLSKQ
jgi:hypothetical protein